MDNNESRRERSGWVRRVWVKMAAAAAVVLTAMLVGFATEAGREFARAAVRWMGL